MKRIMTTLLVVLLVAASNAAWAASKQVQEMQDATSVLNDFVSIPEDSIPPALLRQAYGIAVIPSVIKAGFVVGGRYGTGVLSVRTADGKWSHPVFIRLAGASVGWQIGASSTDIILVFKTQRGVDKIIDGEVTLGADAAVAAGPVGRSAGAATNLRLNAEIYSYSRSRGLFAGVSLEGGVITIDADANWSYYGEQVDSRTILHRNNLQQLPKAGRRFVYTLDQYMPSANTSSGPIPYGDTGHDGDEGGGYDNNGNNGDNAQTRPDKDGQSRSLRGAGAQPYASGSGANDQAGGGNNLDFGPVYATPDSGSAANAGQAGQTSGNSYNDIAGSSINY